MKEIKITSLHPGLAPQNGENEALGIMGSQYGLKFIWQNPGMRVDFVIVSHLIYYDKKLFNLFLSYLHQNVILIYIAGECISPDLNLFDYAIVFDRHLSCEDRVIRRPTLSFFAPSVFEEYRCENISREMIDLKREFCNFMYSNPNAHPMRDMLFYRISEYKRVDAIGPHLRNVNVKTSRTNKDWRRLSIEARRPYRFSIASENASFPGYTSEKLLCCLQAHTIPIYWGDSSIGEEFNTKAFINVHEYNSIEDVIERVREVDNNDSLFLQILNEPWQTPEQVIKTKKATDEYKTFVAHIFLQNKDEAKRIIGGTHPDKYKAWIEYRYKRRFLDKILTTVTKIKQKI